MPGFNLLSHICMYSLNILTITIIITAHSASVKLYAIIRLPQSCDSKSGHPQLLGQLQDLKP